MLRYFALTTNSFNIMSRKPPFLFLIASLSLLTGCESKPQFEVYSVSKEYAQDERHKEVHQEKIYNVSDNALVGFQTPSHWEETAPGAMQLRVFKIREGSANAEFSVSAFAGNVGGLLANINRWRQQINLPPIPENEITEYTKDYKTDNYTFKLVRLWGEEDDSPSISVAMVHNKNQTWFFKLQGPRHLVKNERNAFIQLIKSLQLP